MVIIGGVVIIGRFALGRGLVVRLIVVLGISLGVGGLVVTGRRVLSRGLNGVVIGRGLRLLEGGVVVRRIPCRGRGVVAIGGGCFRGAFNSGVAGALNAGRSSSSA